MSQDAPLVAPFAGERYAAGATLDRLIAPPYDVISREERAQWAGRDPHNIVHVMLPEAPAGEDRYARAASLLAEWRRAGVLARDGEPAVYVMAQVFVTPAGERRTRVGMFGAVRAEPYAAGRVRPHERTHSGPKADRLALLRATRTNLESIFLLAPDPDGALGAALRAVSDGRTAPAAVTELEGVQILLWVVTGAAGGRLAALANRGPVYIADGHHRYETAVAYAQDDPAADRLLALIVPTSDPGLTILATHRVLFAPARGLPALTEKWRRWFEVSRVERDANRLALLAAAGAGRTACLVALPDANDLLLVLKPDAPLADVEDLGKSPAARSLDVAIVESRVVRLILAAGEATVTTTYTPDAARALAAVRGGTATMAVLLNPTSVAQVLAVADAGDVMPPKSTYFVPKVPSGVVMRPV